MSQLEKTLGGIGVVTVADLQITIAPLSQKDERILWRKLREGAAAMVKAEKETLCEKSSVKKLLDSFRSMPTAYLESVRELTRIAAATDRPTENQLAEFRLSPAGVAIELFERGKSRTEGLTAAGLAAIITNVNAEDVFADMLAITEGDDPK